MTLAAGTTLGPYEILSKLGSGGMGEVYRARDTRLERDVAVKVLPDGFSGDRDRLARFESEARAVAALSHSNILALYDVGEASGVHYAVSELLEGETLRDVIARGALPIRRALEISEQIAKGLAAAHEKGLVHRDVKPENVFITKDGDAKLLDFGLARRDTLIDSGDTHSPTDAILTERGAVVGTVAYMSPEQASGRPIDFRSDQFSLGIVLYEMLAASRPFRRKTAAETLTAIIREEPEPLEMVASSESVPVRMIVERCLSKEPAGRYESTRDLARDLGTWRQRLVSGAPAVPAPDTGALPQPSRGRRKWFLAGIATFAVAVLVGAGALLFSHLREPAPAAGGSPPINTLAVLPFENLMHDPSQDFFVDGMHDALITEVAKLGVLRVTSRSSVMPYKGRPKSMREIAQELAVDALIEGSVLRAGNRVRITAQLILGATDEHVWAESYDRDLEDVLQLLTDVSRAIAAEVRTRVAGGEGRALPQPAEAPPRIRPAAWEAYLKGRQVIVGCLTGADFRKALEPFQQAVDLDPGFAKGWSGLAMANMALGFFRQAPVTEVLPRAREAAQKALALDDRSGEAWGVLGTIQLYFDWDFGSAKLNLERAVELAPHDLLIRHAWADYLMVTGRVEQSVEQVKLGRSYEPASSLAQGIVLFHTMTTRRYDEVIVEARRTVAAFPKFATARGILGDALWRKGRYDEALEQYRILFGSENEELRLMENALRRAGPRAALKAYADSIASQVQAAGRGNPLGVAKSYAEAGEHDLAFRWLEKAFSERTPQLLHIVADPAYDDLREDPRYRDLVGRIGIPMAGGARTKG
jgi:TolB-like protein/Flp pilus assembly protein TadD